MKSLKHIEDRPLIDDDSSKFTKRFAARAVLFDENGLVPMLFVSKYKYHKLPGGGIEKGEGKRMALDREIKEETGCKVDITREVGKITEYRSKFKMFQTSYCYIGKITKKGVPNFEKGEMNEGFKLIWVSLSEAILQLYRDRPSNYEGKFIQKRDLRFLEEAKICLEK